MKLRVKQMIDEVSRIINEVPEITHLGNPVLREVCAEVSQEEGVTTANKLIKVLDHYRSLTGVGAGLAAPQVGIAEQVFVTYDGRTKESTVYINPKITKTSVESNYYRESCLSSRMFWSDTERPITITLTWTDLAGQKHEEEFTSFKARLLQHEYDHLLGIPCLDKAIPGTIEYSGDVKLEKLRDNPNKY
jgi:peptide deformylase